MIASTLGLAIVAIIAMFVGAFTQSDMSGGVWPTVAVLPIVGLPIGFILIIVFLVVTALRRAREAKDA